MCAVFIFSPCDTIIKASRAVAGVQSGSSLSASMREDVLWQVALYGIKVFLVILSNRAIVLPRPERIVFTEGNEIRLFFKKKKKI